MPTDTFGATTSFALIICSPFGRHRQIVVVSTVSWEGVRDVVSDCSIFRVVCNADPCVDAAELRHATNKAAEQHIRISIPAFQPDQARYTVCMIAESLVLSGTL